MKVTNGWISNSSSSSFIINLPEKIKNEEDFSENFFNMDTIPSDEKKMVKSIRNELKNKSELKNTEIFPQLVANWIYNSENYCIDEDKMKIERISSDKSHKQIVDYLWEKFQNCGKINSKDILDSKYEYRKFYKISDIKEQLEDEKSYLYQVIRQNIYWQFENLYIDSTNSNNSEQYFTCQIFDMLKDEDIEENLTNFVNLLTKKEIERIKEYYNEVSKDFYIITWCTDDGEATEWDTIMRSQKTPIMKTDLCIRDENS